MPLIQATAEARPIHRRIGDDYYTEFNVSENPQYLTADIPAGLAGAAACTFAMWYKRIGAVDAIVANPTIFGVSPDGGSLTNTLGIISGTLSGTQIISFTGLGQIVASSAVFPASAINDGEWVHIAGVMTGTEMILYRGGVVQDTASLSGGVASDLSAYRIAVGAARDGVRPARFGGSNFQIWDRALSAGEVATLAAVRHPANTIPSGLIGYWPL